MPTLNDALRRRLAAKFGSTIDLKSESDIVSALLTEIAAGFDDVVTGFDPGIIAAYDKTYQEGYNKEGYSKQDYVKYDRTEDHTIYEQVIQRIRPELEQLIRDNLRKATGKATA